MANDNLPPVKLSDFRTVGWRTDPHKIEREANAPIELDNEHIRTTINNGISFLKKTSEKLLQTDLDSGYCEKCKRSGPTPESLGKTFSYVAKTIDEIARLVEFNAGRADSRQEVVGFSDLAKFLTNEQFAQVMTWVAGSQQSIEVNP